MNPNKSKRSSSGDAGGVAAFGGEPLSKFSPKKDEENNIGKAGNNAVKAADGDTRKIENNAAALTADGGAEKVKKNNAERAGNNAGKTANNNVEKIANNSKQNESKTKTEGRGRSDKMRIKDANGTKVADGKNGAAQTGNKTDAAGGEDKPSETKLNGTRKTNKANEISKSNGTRKINETSEANNAGELGGIKKAGASGKTRGTRNADNANKANGENNANSADEINEEKKTNKISEISGAGKADEINGANNADEINGAGGADRRTETSGASAVGGTDAAKRPLKILFAASEAGPFIRSGGLGDVAASLPKALKKNGCDIRVVLPLYLDIDWSWRSQMRYLGALYVPLSWRRQYCGVFEAEYGGVTYYFIDNEYYFKRSGIYGHFDDAERFAFFSKAVLAAMSVTGFYPDVLHVNDWQTALTPVFLDVFYRYGEYSGIKTVFTIHNIEFQGKYGLNIGEDIIGLDKNAMRLVEYDKCVNFMKGAIETSNAVTTVSDAYAREILDPFYSYGLEGILKRRQYKISGIINGIDTDVYNPATDKALLKNFTFDTIENKRENKRNLLDMICLPYSENRPLIGMVTRLTSQKGMDLVSRVAEDILGKDISFVVLGKGDWKYETMLKDFENYYPNKIKAIVGFSLDVASKIYGGADFLLMPSKFEPCGLSQMIAMRYGAVPIVREAGGLKDTVEAYNYLRGTGNGFTFKSYDAYDMLDAINRAIDVYYKKDEFKKVVRNAMASDFSWTESARKYEELYRKL